jgi:hypothetical protein
MKKAPSTIQIPGTPTDRKDTTFSPSMLKVYRTLQRGGAYSVVELTTTLNLADPRGAIRFLRNAGVAIGDYWEYSDFSHFKKYFLHDGD